MQVVLGRLALDVLRLVREQRARGVDPLAARLEHGGDRVLREPVELEIRMELSELVRDRDVTPRMAQPDRRGDVEGALAPRLAANPARAGARRGDEVAQQQVDLDRVADVRPVSEPSSRTSSPPVASASATPRPARLIASSVHLDDQHGTLHAATELARPPPCRAPARGEWRRESRRRSRAPTRPRPRSASSSAAP